MAADLYRVRDSVVLMPASLRPYEPSAPPEKRIAVLMSGGVDSSVCAALLKERSWDVLGITMKVPSCDSGVSGCCGADAAFVCDELGISHYFVDVCRAFTELIIKPFKLAYQQGQTPNPCADCNTYLKFALVWDLVLQEFGIENLATGHYAEIREYDGHKALGQATDKTKDQSYFLYGIKRERLGRLAFPLAGIAKTRTRQIAAGLGLKVKEKPESMELCFAGQGDYRDVLGVGDSGKPGPVVDTSGNELGEHKGLGNYTLGQRKGIGIASTQPLYVAKIDIAANTLVLGRREEVLIKEIRADSLNILMPSLLGEGQEFLGKIRSYTGGQQCRITDIGDDRLTVQFDKPVFAPCPGQKLVLYDSRGNVVVGGTIIS